MMGLYPQRVQTVLTADQYDRLLRTSVEMNKPVSVLIREAVETVYFAPTREVDRLEALRELLTIGAPVADWKEMEAEIIRGASAE